MQSARLYDAMYHFKDYEVASAQLMELVRGLHPKATTLLDVACSTGRHLEHLQRHFQVEGLDISPDLLAVARERLPGVSLHVADMTNFTLPHKFDIVTCLFSSVAYARTRDRLAQAIACMSKALDSNGLLLIEPWLSPEQYWRNNIVLNVAQEPHQKLVWMYVGREENGVVTNEIHYLLGTPDGVTSLQEVHHMGLFRDDDYQAAFRAARLSLVHSDSTGFFGNGLYIARNER